MLGWAPTFCDNCNRSMSGGSLSCRRNSQPHQPVSALPKLPTSNRRGEVVGRWSHVQSGLNQSRIEPRSNRTLSRPFGSRTE